MEVNELIDLIDDIIEYLHDWVSSREGKYIPISIQQVEATYMTLVANNRGDFIKAIYEYKDKVNSGDILLPRDPTLSEPKLKKYYNQLYEIHAKKVKEFEKKHIIYGGHNNSNN